MAIKKCPICDGTISNGRCSFCGMPYRRDELLYHLNESQSDHYRHAAPKARAKMEAAHSPTGEKGSISRSATAQKKSGSTKNTVYGQASPQPKAASQKMSGTASAARKAANRSRTYKSFGSVSPKRRRKKNRLVFWILFFVFLFNLLDALPAILGRLRYNPSLSQLISTITQGDFSGASQEEEEIVPDYLSSTTYVTYLLPGQEPLVTGVDFPEGAYIFASSDGNAEILITDANGGKTYVQVQNQDPNPMPLYLAHGMAVSISDSDSEYCYVDIRSVYMPDESSYS